jgi:spore coat polysaccharide biosynthesis protein SpsF
VILAILQARFSSSRLPGKVLKPILDKPMLLHQIERIQNSKRIDNLVVATSNEKSDDGIEKMCLNNNVEVYRGNLDNVLDRFYQCANQYNPKHVVRLTGDCPLIDSQVIDQVIDKHLFTKSSYTSNAIPPTYPDGLDVEIFKLSTLIEAWNYAKLPSELEHVSPYIRKHLDPCKKFNLEYEVDLSEHRWTVDDPEDFRFVKKVYSELYPNNRNFNMRDILDLLKRKPNLRKINYHINRNEGLLKAYKKDNEFLKNEI